MCIYMLWTLLFSVIISSIALAFNRNAHFSPSIYQELSTLLRLKVMATVNEKHVHTVSDATNV